jgi:hypothetical protein
MIARLREERFYPDDPRKEDPLDILMWQPSAPGEPSWSTPWDGGRPGWHIECTAMALKHIGPTVDVHGGGEDLLFSHHESERVQAEAYTGVSPFVRFWMYAGTVYFGAEKMSKSLGNLVLVRELLPRYSADAIRLYLAREHYRTHLTYEEGQLAEAEDLVGLHESLGLRICVLLAGGQVGAAEASAVELLALIRDQEQAGMTADWSADITDALTRLGRGSELARPLAGLEPTPWLEGALPGPWPSTARSAPAPSPWRPRPCWRPPPEPAPARGTRPPGGRGGRRPRRWRCGGRGPRPAGPGGGGGRRPAPRRGGRSARRCPG